MVTIMESFVTFSNAVGCAGDLRGLSEGDYRDRVASSRSKTTTTFDRQFGNPRFEFRSDFTLIAR